MVGWNDGGRGNVTISVMSPSQTSRPSPSSHLPVGHHNTPHPPVPHSPSSQPSIPIPPSHVPPSPQVARAYRACVSIARAHYENFPVASWLLPRAMRPHVAAVYAYARVAD